MLGALNGTFDNGAPSMDHNGYYRTFARVVRTPSPSLARRRPAPLRLDLDEAVLQLLRRLERLPVSVWSAGTLPLNSAATGGETWT